MIRTVIAQTSDSPLHRLHRLTESLCEAIKELETCGRNQYGIERELVDKRILRDIRHTRDSIRDIARKFDK